jgi:hypothetical protein
VGSGLVVPLVPAAALVPADKQNSLAARVERVENSARPAESILHVLVTRLLHGVRERSRMRLSRAYGLA